MALLLIRPEFDVWKPGEHTGTFRGNNLAFVTAAEALTYWQDDTFRASIETKGALTIDLLSAMVARYPEARGWVRGRGLINALGLDVPGLAARVSQAAFEQRLIIETAGPNDEVLKLLPPLTISDEELRDGIARIGLSLETALTGAARSTEAVSAI